MFEFEIHHREGIKHQNADSLSRRPCNERCKWCKGWKGRMQVPVSHVGVQTEFQETELQRTEIPDGYRHNHISTVKIEPMWTLAYLQSQQQDDKDLQVFIKLKKSMADKPSWEVISTQSTIVKALWAQWNRLFFKEGVLFRRWENNDGSQVIDQLVLPRSLQESALTAHHNHTTASHLGIRRTLNSVRVRYYWPGLTSAVHRWVKACHDCGAKKSFGRKRRSPLKQYMVGAPMERLAIDVMGPLKETPRKNKHILVVTDYFTKWTESYPIPNQEAPMVAEKLVSEFICRFGVPRQLHSDQGTNFESKVMAEVCRLLNIEKTRTTPLHHQSDGQVERFNRTLKEMLIGKIKDDQSDWDLQLASCMLAYRSSIHESTGMSPNHLMLGRELEVPLDVTTELSPDAPLLRTDYAEALQERLSKVHELARDHLKKAANRQKRNYDKLLAGHPFKLGDTVWLHHVKRKKGRSSKLDCPWHGPYLITSILSDVVYRIQRSPRSKPTVVHSDRLKPYLGPPLKSWLPDKSQVADEHDPGQGGKREKDQTMEITPKRGAKTNQAPNKAKDHSTKEKNKGGEDSVIADTVQGVQAQDSSITTADVAENPSQPKLQSKNCEFISEQVEVNAGDEACINQRLTGGRPTRRRRPPNRLGSWVT